MSDLVYSKKRNILTHDEKETIVHSFRTILDGIFLRLGDELENAVITAMESNEAILRKHEADIIGDGSSDDGIKKLIEELKPDFVKVGTECVREFTEDVKKELESDA